MEAVYSFETLLDITTLRVIKWLCLTCWVWFLLELALAYCKPSSYWYASWDANDAGPLKGPRIDMNSFGMLSLNARSGGEKLKGA
jgi:hypothetical protein